MQVMAKYLQNVQSRMMFSLVMARVLGLLLLIVSVVEMVKGLSAGDATQANLAFVQLYQLSLGLMLLTLSVRLVKQAGAQRLFSTASRQLMILLARVGLLAALLVKPCGLMVLGVLLEGTPPEPAFLKFVGLVDWPVVVLSGLLHLMAGLQKLGSEMNEEQELTI